MTKNFKKVANKFPLGVVYSTYQGQLFSFLMYKK